MSTNQQNATWAIAGVVIGALICYAVIRTNNPQTKELTTGKLAPEAFQSVEKANSAAVDIHTAAKGIKNYRNPAVFTRLDANWDRKAFGIVHTKKDFDSLYEATYVKFINTHDAPAGHRWDLGLFYSIVDTTTDASMHRLNVYFIPILVNEAEPFQVSDFYTLYLSAGNKDPYKKYLKPASAWKDDDKYIFDQGTLFP